MRSPLTSPPDFPNSRRSCRRAVRPEVGVVNIAVALGEQHAAEVVLLPEVDAHAIRLHHQRLHGQVRPQHVAPLFHGGAARLRSYELIAQAYGMIP